MIDKCIFLVIVVDCGFVVGIFIEGDMLYVMCEYWVMQMLVGVVMILLVYIVLFIIDFCEVYCIVVCLGICYIVVIDENGLLVGVVSEFEFCYYFGLDFFCYLNDVDVLMECMFLCLLLEVLFDVVLGVMEIFCVICVVVVVG